MRGALVLLCLALLAASLAAGEEPAPITVPGLWSGPALLAPAREAFKPLGFRQTWDATTDAVRLKGPGGALSLVIGATKAEFSPAAGEPREATLPVAPRYVGGVLYVPLEGLWTLAGVPFKLTAREPYQMEYVAQGRRFLIQLPGAEAAPQIAAATGSVVELQTARGCIYLELFDDKTPVTAGSFLDLVARGFYDGLTFHRVIAGFMIQGGDPNGDGTGGPGFTVPDEADKGLKHLRGSLSMAKTAAPNTGGSQFFICHVPCPHLDGVHTVFGRTIQGLAVVDRIQVGDAILRALVLKQSPLAAEAIRRARQARVPERPTP